MSIFLLLAGPSAWEGGAGAARGSGGFNSVEYPVAFHFEFDSFPDRQVTGLIGY